MDRQKMETKGTPRDEVTSGAVATGSAAALGLIAHLCALAEVPFKFAILQIAYCGVLIAFVIKKNRGIMRAIYLSLIILVTGISLLFSDDDIKAHFVFWRANMAMQNGNYEEALELYQSPVLAEYPAAILNTGYLYEKGLLSSSKQDYNPDLEKAIEYYTQVDTSAAYRGQLSCYIQMQTGLKEWNSRLVEKIYSIIDILVEKKDIRTLNYLTNCAFNKSYSEANRQEREDLTSIDLGLLCRWEENGYYCGYSAPSDGPAKHYEFASLKHNNEGGISQPYVVYKTYTIINIDQLDAYQFSLQKEI